MTAIDRYRVFELFLLVFIFSGFFKEYSSLVGFDIDFTIISGSICFLFSLLTLFKRSSKDVQWTTTGYTALILLFVLTTWIFISFLWSPSSLYKYTKFIGYSTGLVGFLSVFLRRTIDLKFFYKGYVLLSTSFSTILLGLLIVLKGSYAYEQVKNMYLLAGYMQGVSVLLVMYSFGKHFKWSILLRWVFLVFSIALVWFLGARGPLLFLMLSICVFLFSQLMIKERQRFRTPLGINALIVFLFLGSLLTLALLLLSNNLELDALAERLRQANVRFSLLLQAANPFVNADPGVSISNRYDLLRMAWNGLFSDMSSFFIGKGFSSFGPIFFQEDTRHYPHNLLLELWFELGLVGLTTFSLFFTYATKGLIKSKFKPFHWTLILFFVLNLMKSQSLADIRLVMIFLALSLLSPFLAHTEELQGKAEHEE